jgi:hypothetical protein
MTSAAASRIVVNTFLIERSMKTVESKPTSIEVPSGIDALIAGSTRLTAFATSRGLATACLTMPIEMAVWPS